ncbi:MAG TPA: dTDP-4-dehydrorhamnose 3,5-epimerase family protein [Allosphingosinicella sp.]
MLIEQTPLPDLLVPTPGVLPDERGFFTESYNKRAFAEAAGADVDFVQANHSRSIRGVLRGLHYQLPPRAQGKLAGVAAGEIGLAMTGCLSPSRPRFSRSGSGRRHKPRRSPGHAPSGPICRHGPRPCSS